MTVDPEFVLQTSKVWKGQQVIHPIENGFPES